MDRSQKPTTGRGGNLGVKSPNPLIFMAALLKTFSMGVQLLKDLTLRNPFIAILKCGVVRT